MSGELSSRSNSSVGKSMDCHAQGPEFNSQWSFFPFLIEGNVLFKFKSLRLFRVKLAFSQRGDYGSIILPRGDYGFIILPGVNSECQQNLVLENTDHPVHTCTCKPHTFCHILQSYTIVFHSHFVYMAFVLKFHGNINIKTDLLL